MAERHLETISTHARYRLAQRNLSQADIDYVLRYGRLIRNARACFVYLGRRDIPRVDHNISERMRLEGTVLVLDPFTGSHLTTAYRNRRTGIRDIKRKGKHSG